MFPFLLEKLRLSGLNFSEKHLMGESFGALLVGRSSSKMADEDYEMDGGYEDEIEEGVEPEEENAQQEDVPDALMGDDKNEEQEAVEWHRKTSKYERARILEVMKIGGVDELIVEDSWKRQVGGD